MSKLKRGFTLFEILIVIAIVGITYTVVFMPLTTKFNKQKEQDSSLLSITRHFNALRDAQSNIFALECSSDFKECYFYDEHNSKLNKAFTLNVKNPKEAFVLTQNEIKSIWQPSYGNFRLIFNGTLKEVFIEDEDGVYKIGALAKNNFLANSKDEAIKKAKEQIATSMDMLAK